MEIARAIRTVGTLERLRVSCRECGMEVFDTNEESVDGGPESIEDAALGSMKTHNRGTYHVDFDVEIQGDSPRVERIDVRLSARDDTPGR